MRAALVVDVDGRQLGGLVPLVLQHGQRLLGARPQLGPQVVARTPCGAGRGRDLVHVRLGHDDHLVEARHQHVAGGDWVVVVGDLSATWR